GMSIDASGQVTWTPTSAGSFNARVRVADAQDAVEQFWSINVLAADVRNRPATTPTHQQTDAAPISRAASSSAAAGCRYRDQASSADVRARR
ncbi:MAG: putative Ig domain-containing protein, partial [Pseudomarimonas sp.]